MALFYMAQRIYMIISPKDKPAGMLLTGSGMTVARSSDPKLFWNGYI